MNDQYNGRGTPFQQHSSSAPFLRHSFSGSTAFGDLAQAVAEQERLQEKQKHKKSSSSSYDHTRVPLMITAYVQAIFNFLLMVGIVYAFYCFGWAVHQDIEMKAEEYRKEVASEISSCAREYETNRCDPNERIPAMQKTCEVWKNCMNQDPNVVARAKITAHTVAEILNSFIEPISYKTMIFFAMLIVVVIVGSNVGFGIGRRALSPETKEMVVYKKK